MKSVIVNRLQPSPSIVARMCEGQRESANIWNLCMNMHKTARSNHKKWPKIKQFQDATRGQFALNSQSVQQVFRSFVKCIETTKKLRKEHPEMKMRYPHEEKQFQPIAWPRQAMSYKDGRLTLPMGRENKSIVLRVDLPEDFGGCKIVWNCGYELHVTVPQEQSQEAPGIIKACIDLGEIHLAAVATEDGEAVVISGRGIRTLKRQRQKQHGKIRKLQSRCKKGSRRYRTLGRTMGRIASRMRRRVKDLRHKATRKAIDFCIKQNVGMLYVGNPHGVRDRDCGHKHNDRMAKWEYGKDIEYLRHKSSQARIECFTGTERGTSSQCPMCGHRHKPKGRDWKCKRCGFKGHRDVVGAVNMHKLAFSEQVPFPRKPTYLLPGAIRNSSRAGTPHETSVSRYLGHRATCQPHPSGMVLSRTG